MKYATTLFKYLPAVVGSIIWLFAPSAWNLRASVDHFLLAVFRLLNVDPSENID